MSGPGAPDYAPDPRAGSGIAIGAHRIYPRALLVGAAITVAVGVPAGLLNRMVEGSDPDPTQSSTLSLLLAVAVVAGAVAGGFAAASRSPSSLLTNGAVAAFAGQAAMQLVRVVSRLARSEDVPWLGVAHGLLLMSCCGILGALVANRRQARMPSHLHR